MTQHGYVSRLRRKLSATLVLATSACCLCSCAEGGDAAFESIRSGHENADRGRSYASWNDLLMMSMTGEIGADPVDAAVVGDVVDVRQGRSFRWVMGDHDEEVRIETEFGSPKAMSSTYHLTVAVSNVVGSTIRGAVPGADLQVGIAVNPKVTLEQVEQDFGDIKDAVFFLEQSPVYDYEPNLWAITEDGVLLAVPDDNGNLSFPLLPEHDDVQPPEGTDTDDLLKGAS